MRYEGNSRPIPLLVRDRIETLSGYHIRESASPQEAEALIIDKIRSIISMMDAKYHSPFIKNNDMARSMAEIYALLDAFTRIAGIDADCIGKIAATQTKEVGDYTKMLVMEPITKED